MARLIQKQTPEERKDKARWSRIKRVYGLTKEQYDGLDAGSCHICLRDWSPTVRPCVDHDHKTGEVRGIICLYCNHRVVGRHRDALLIYRLAAYLEGPFKFVMPPKKKRKVKRKKN